MCSSVHPITLFSLSLSLSPSLCGCVLVCLYACVSVCMCRVACARCLGPATGNGRHQDVHSVAGWERDSNSSSRTSDARVILPALAMGESVAKSRALKFPTMLLLRPVALVGVMVLGVVLELLCPPCCCCCCCCCCICGRFRFGGRLFKFGCILVKGLSSSLPPRPQNPLLALSGECGIPPKIGPKLRTNLFLVRILVHLSL